MRRRSRVLIVGIAAVLAAVTGCSAPGGLASEYGGDVDGAGQHQVLTLIPAKERTDPVAFTAPAVDGGTVDVASYRGRVLIVNLWYAGCVPCREEAPVLAAFAERHSDEVAVLGVDTVDTAPVAQQFMDRYDVPYPSALDAHGAPVREALQRSILANATPTTVALDPDGRVAGRVLGAITEKQLTRLVDAAR
jgi:thiol-disulfide isomerase/thioredoxin